MAEDRKYGSPVDKVEQFEVLDEVGAVEGWDGEFPDDDDVQVIDAEEKAVADLVPQSNKKQETVATENEPVCVKPSSVKNNNSSTAYKENKEQSQMSLNKESSPNRDVKSEPSASKEVQSNEATPSNDVKLKEKESSSSKDAKSKESSSSKDAKSKESSSSKDEKSKESSSSKDAKSKESSSSKDAKSKEFSSGKDAKSKASSTSKVKIYGKYGISSKTSEDKKKSETEGSESLPKSMDSALKRTNDPEAQGPEGKKMKLCIERLDYDKLKLVVEMVNSKKMNLTIKRLGDNELKIHKVHGEEELVVVQKGVPTCRGR